MSGAWMLGITVVEVLILVAIGAYVVRGLYRLDRRIREREEAERAAAGAEESTS